MAGLSEQQKELFRDLRAHLQGVRPLRPKLNAGSSMGVTAKIPVSVGLEDDFATGRHNLDDSIAG